MNKNLIVHIVSMVAIILCMVQFWCAGLVAGIVLWGIAAACAIYSLHESTRLRGKAEEAKKWMLNLAFVIACIVLVGLAISASVLLAPAIK